MGETRHQGRKRGRVTAGPARERAGADASLCLQDDQSSPTPSGLQYRHSFAPCRPFALRV
jgi:hypothetical protein